MKDKFLSICLLACFSIGLQAQNFDALEIPFTVNNQELANSLVGGLNAPQFSSVDLNNDGVLDLYIFDRKGHNSLTFLNDNVLGETSYTYAPMYERNFPIMHNWVLLRDYNDDGAMDIICYSDVPGFQAPIAYKGYFDDNQLKFNKVLFPNDDVDAIYITLANGTRTNLFISPIDYPAMDDVDLDGDMDIITFNSGGSLLEFYENRSVDQGFGKDTLIFRRKDYCWGGMYEDANDCNITLAGAPGECASGFTNAEERHAGSTVLTLDIDGDEDKEVVIGDLICSNLTMLTNDGDLETAWFNDKDLTFPSYDVSVDINEFPASYYLDLDNDGVRDLMAAPNDRSNTPNIEVARFYKNNGTDDSPDFEWQQNDLIVDNVVDLGTGAYPAFWDYDADGLLDLIVGNNTVYQSDGNFDSRLFLYRNTGTATNPAYELVDDNYLNFTSYNEFNLHNFAPTAGDYDNDGDDDLIVGTSDGTLFLVENTAGAGQPFANSTVVPNWNGFDINQNSIPQIIDLNADGLNDIVVGARNGFIAYFQNQGSAGNPSFNNDSSEAPNKKRLGEMDTELSWNVTIGNAAPMFVPTPEGIFYITGTMDGPLQLYENTWNSLDSIFTLVKPNYGNIRVGENIRPAIADINGDGMYDMLIGNSRGGLTGHTTTLSVSGILPNTELAFVPEINLYPNPVTDILTIDFVDYQMDNPSLKVFNAIGQEMQSGNGLQLSVRDLPNGVYFLSITGRGEQFVKRFVKQ